MFHLFDLENMPDYERISEEYASEYRSFLRDVSEVLSTYDIDSDKPRQTEAEALAVIATLVAAINEKTEDWVSKTVTNAVTTGIESADYALKGSIGDITVSRANQALSDAVKQDTYNDILAVTQNVDRRVKATIRKVTSRVYREKLAVDDVNQLNNELLRKLRTELRNTIDIGIIDASGRRWKPDVYVKMLTRTKLAQAEIDATVNEAVKQGALYGIITTNPTTVDACLLHERRIVRLTDVGDERYPTIDDLRSTLQIFHPNCRHRVVPYKGNLPDDILEEAERMERIGNNALSTGKRVFSKQEIDQLLNV